MDLQRTLGQLLVLCTLVIGPLFGAIVDLLYLAILLLTVGKMRCTRGLLVASFLCIFFSAFLLVINPDAEAPFFSYFFARLSVLLFLFGSTPSLCKAPGPAILYGLFVIYVGAILYQYLALPGSEVLQKLQAEKIVEEAIGYRASGLFSGFFSAATVIGSLGVVLLRSSGLLGSFLVSLGMLAVAFCSGRSIVVYLAVGLVGMAWRAPRVAIGVGLMLGVTLTLVLLQLSASFASGNSDIHNSLTLFLQIGSVLSGDVSGTSTEALLRDQYYLPSELGTLLLGNNERPFSSQGVASDSGYIQLLFGAGLIGGTVYLAVLSGFVLSRATSISIGLLAAMVIVSFKGNAFIAIGVLDILFLFAAKTGVLERRASHCGVADLQVVTATRGSST